MRRLKGIQKSDGINYQIECPHKPLGTLDCGYYVCRYMFETVQLRRLVHMSEINTKHK
ncbi:hypothetical protein BVRB_1g005570 [Beta vulgaris subsp. vulgaris]|nr:hypothetical protein BVRB_1g005570 [Beta vulgaris subsp. vulgaris]